jgi:hypothetical protein
MAERVYLPHHLGTIVGSHVLRPWLASDAQEAIDTPWQGQPAFGSAADAYAWLYWARMQPWLPAELAIARTDAQPAIDTTRPPRLHVNQDQLRDPDHQVLRTHPAGAGPDEQALAACFGMARAAAAKTWLFDQAGADSRTRIDAVVRGVWEYGYRLAAGDAHTALAGHVQRSVRAVQAAMSATTLGRPRGPAWSFLDNLGRAAAAIVDAAPKDPPDLGSAVLAEFRAQMREGGELGAWDDVLAAVWKHTLRAAVLDAVGATAEALTVASLADPATANHARVDGQPAKQWRNITLNDANRAVAVGWLFATAHLASPPQPRPDAAHAPLLPNRDNDDRPDDEADDWAAEAPSSVEADTAVAAVPVPESRSRPGRAFPMWPVITDHTSTPTWPPLPAAGPGEQPPVAGPAGRHR